MLKQRSSYGQVRRVLSETNAVVPPVDASTVQESRATTSAEPSSNSASLTKVNSTGRKYSNPRTFSDKIFEPAFFDYRDSGNGVMIMTRSSPAVSPRAALTHNAPEIQELRLSATRLVAVPVPVPAPVQQDEVEADSSAAPPNP